MHDTTKADTATHGPWSDEALRLLREWDPNWVADAERMTRAAWDPFFMLDPAWTDAFMAAAAGVFLGGIEPKLAELLSIAFDASIRHLYAPGARRHIRAALALGATVGEVMGVLQICVAQGVQASNMGVPILAEELARAKGQGKAIE